MRAIELQLSEEEQRLAEGRAAELGYKSLAAYVESLVRADVEVPISEELEAKLLEARKSPGREITPADWEEKRRRLTERFGQAKAG
jgi:hypothetical protein